MNLRPIIAGAAVLFAALFAASQAADQVAAEITRVTAAVAEVVPQDSRGGITARLDRAAAAIKAGNIYLALYDLQVGVEGEGGYRVASSRPDVGDQAAFRARWSGMGPPSDPPASKAPVLFVEALAQSAEGRAPATYRASLPYAQDAGIEAGLYYLGESHAMVAFASFCRRLPLRVSGRRPALRSIEPELGIYERQVVKAYDGAAAAQRPQYAGVNVAIKLARTLDEQKRHEGALLQYLVSRYRFALVSGGERQVPSIEQLKSRLAGIKLPAGVDHSLAEFFLQLALATAGGPAADGRGAASILDDILPAYFAVVNP